MSITVNSSETEFQSDASAYLNAKVVTTQLTLTRTRVGWRRRITPSTLLRFWEELLLG